MANDGSCQLVPGLSPPDHSATCRENKDLISFYLPTGYRHIPLDTCQGGHELEYVPSEKYSCKGHEDEFEDEQRKSGGLRGFAWFLLVVCLPIAVGVGAGYWVYTHWDGKLGAIRLGDAGSTTYSPLGGRAGGAFDPERPWIKYPIIGLSAVVAVVASTPLLVGSVWRWGKNLLDRGGGYSAMGGGSGGRWAGSRQQRYTTRSDFARGGRYAVVDPDEDELLGDDDEELGTTAANVGGGGNAGRFEDDIGDRGRDAGGGM